MIQISIIESVQGTRNKLATGRACEATPVNVKGNFIDVIYTKHTIKFLLAELARSPLST